MSLLTKASLVTTPTAYGDGVLNSVKPTSGDGDFDFARASAATRVNEQGLIEKERGNLLLQSNSFDTTWTTNNASVTGGQSGYDGSSDAWLLTKSGTQGRVEQTISASGVQSFSIYAKKNASDFLRVFVNGSSSSIYFDLTDGSIQSSSSIINGKTTDLGGDWYRCEVSFDGSITKINIYPAESGSTAATSGSIYIQDAQVEQGLVATDYIETTTAAVYEGITDNIPRINYENGIGSLLLEPQRTNLIPYSEYLNGSGWVFSNSSVTDNIETSPEGVVNASKIVENTTTNGHTIYINRSVTLGASYTFSVFAKAAGRDKIWIDFFGGANVAVFDLTDGSVLSQAGTGLVADSEDYGNGWYRCYITQNAVDATIYPNFGPTTSSTTINTYLGDGTSGIYVYGAQLEAGSYPTSYIPTYGASVTRVSDSCVKTSATDLIGQTEGTIYAETFVLNGKGQDTNGIWLRNSSSLYGEMIVIFFSPYGESRAVINSGAVAQIDFTGASVSEGYHKIALTYKENDFVLYVDGVQIQTSSSGLVPNCNEIYIDNYIDGGIRNSSKKQVSLFKTRLSSEELECLTSWSSFNRMATAQGYTIQ